MQCAEMDDNHRKTDLLHVTKHMTVGNVGQMPSFFSLDSPPPENAPLGQMPLFDVGLTRTTLKSVGKVL